MNERDQTGRFRIRPARETDVPAMVDLLDALFAAETDFERDRGKQRRGLTTLLQAGPDRAVLLVAEARGQVIGMATAQVLISTAEGGPVGLVEDVVVDANRRGKGIGSALLHALETWSKQRGLKRLQLLADVGNQAVVAFWERRGWQRSRLGMWRKRLDRDGRR